MLVNKLYISIHLLEGVIQWGKQPATKREIRLQMNGNRHDKTSFVKYEKQHISTKQIMDHIPVKICRHVKRQYQSQKTCGLYLLAVRVTLRSYGASNQCQGHRLKTRSMLLRYKFDTKLICHIVI